MDLHRLYALTRHWRVHPPVHVLVASYLGYEPPSPTILVKQDQEVGGELAQLLMTMPVRKSPAVDDSAWRAALGETEPSNG